MSELFVNKIQSHTDANNHIEVASGHYIYAPSQGMIVQHVQKTYETQSTTTSTSYVELFTQTITPRSSSSKIYVNLLAFADHANYHTGGIQVLRGSTVLKSGQTGGASISIRTGSFNTANGQAYIAHPWTFKYMDSPATTSQLTYKVQYATGNASYATAFNRSVNRVQQSGINDAGYLTVLDLYEIAQ